MDYQQVSGQLQGMWEQSMKAAEEQGRISGEAVGVESVLQAVGRALDEVARPAGHWSGDTSGFVQELRRRLSVPNAEGEERLTADEWAARRGAQEQDEAAAREKERRESYQEKKPGLLTRK